MSAQADTYYWIGGALTPGGDPDNNWSTAANWNKEPDGSGASGVPGTADTVILSGNESITLTDNAIIKFLFIFSGANTSTLDLGGKELTVSSRIRLGQNTTGNLILTNGTVTTAEFDTEDNNSNSLTLNDTSFSVTSKLLLNGNGTTTVSGTGTSSFNVSPDVTFYENNANVISFGTGVTVNSPNTVWTGKNGSSWSDNANWALGIPSDNSSVIIANVTTPPDLDTATAELKEITIDTNAKFTISSGGTLKTGKVTNNGELTIKGGSITGTTATPTPSFANGNNSSIVYDGATAPIWGNTYNKLKIQSGSLAFSSNITINEDFTISAAFENNANISAKGNVTSTADMTGSGKLIFTGDVEQTFTAGGNSFSNIEKTGNSSLVVNDDFTITGNFTNPSGSGAINFNAGGTFTNAVEFKTTGTVTLDGAFTTANLTFAGPVTINSGSNLSSSAAANIYADTINLAGNITFSSAAGISISPKNAANTTITGSSYTLTNSEKLTLSNGIDVQSAITNTGTLTCGGNATFENDVDLSAGTFSHSSGTVELTAEKKSPATLSGSSTFANLTISGNVNITGSNTINGLLSATGLTGTIAFTGGTTQQAGSLALSGNSGNGNKLNLTSTSDTWTIQAGSAPTTLANLSVTNSNNDSGFTFITTDSTDNGGNSSWAFPGSDYYWRGTSSRDWYVAANWYPQSVPGIGSRIIIQTANATNTNPQLSDDVNIYDSNTDDGTILIKNSTCSLDLGNHKLTVKTITNNGTVSLNGSSNDQITAASMVNGSGSNVEYTGTATAGTTTYFVWDGSPASGSQYENLILNRQNVQVGENLEVEGNLTITQAIEIADSKSISVKKAVVANAGISGSGELVFTGNQVQAFTAGTNTYSNIIIDKNDGSLTASGNCKITNLTITNSPSTVFSGTPEITTINAQNTAGNISFNAGGTFSNDVTFNTSGTVSFTGTTQAASLTHNIANSVTTVSGTLNSANVTLKDLIISGTANINTSGNQVYNGKVYGGGNLDLNSTSGGSGTITFNDEVNAAAPASVLSSLQTTGPVTINTSKIKTSAAQTYNGTLDLGSADSVVLEGSAVNFNDTVSDTSTATSLEVNAPLTINSSSTTTSITTSGIQQYDKTVALGVAATLTAQQAGTPPANQTVTFKGNVTGTTAAGTTLTINANTSIAANLSITTNGNQTYNGTITGTGTKLTTAGDGTAIFTDNVTLGELETQAVQINCASISTTDNQTYNGTTKINVNTNLSAPVNKSIQFNGAITGSAYNLTTSGAAVAEFKNSVNVGNLETQAVKINTTSTITTAATQKYNGALTLAANTTLSAGTSVTFNAKVSGSKSLEVSGPVFVNCAEITTTGNTQTYNDTVNLGVNSKFTASQINFNSNITDGAVANNRKKLTIVSPVLQSTIASGSASIILGELEAAAAAPGNTSVQTEHGTTIAFNVPKISGTDKTITLATNALAANDSSFTFAGDVEVNPNFKTSTGTTFTASAEVMTFKADLDLTSGTFAANNGSIKLTAANKGTNQAVLKGDKTYNTLIFTGPVNIQGNNTITTLTANATTLAGKTISFDAGTSQSVTSMTLQGSGTAADQILTLNAHGTGNWNISCANEPTLQYLSVTKSTNSSNPAKNFVALNSTDAGGNVEWNFPQMPYKWTGGANNDWTNTANWDNNVVPTKGANVEIAAGTFYPILSVNVDLNTSLGSTSYNGTITVDEDATFDIADKNLTVGTITNNGLLKLVGKNRTDGSGQKQIAGIMKNGNNNETGTVEYNSADFETFAWNGAVNQYNNLIISEAITQPAGEPIAVHGTTTINAASTKTVILDNTANVFTGNVIPGTTSTPTGNVTLAATSAENGLIKLANNASAASLTIQTPAIIQSVKTSGVQNYNGNTTISSAANIESTGDSITFAAGKQLAVNAATTITVPASHFINFNGTTTGTAKLTTKGYGTAKFTGNVNNLNSLETQVVDFNCETLTTTGDQTYNGAATISRTDGSTIRSSSGAITFASTSSITGTTNKLKVETGTNASNAISFAGTIGAAGSPFVELEIGTARTTSFTKPVYIGTFKDTGTSGDIFFNAGGTISSDVSFNTTGTVSFTGTTQTAGLTHNIAGSTTIVTGTLNTASVTLKDFIITGTANINTSGNQIYNGKVYGGGTLVLNSTAGGSGTISFNDEVNAAEPAVVLSSLTTTGPVTINTSKIRTSAAQTYNSAIDLGSVPSVIIDASALILKDSITDSDPATSLEVKAPVTINSSNTSLNITTLGNQTYDSTIQFNVPVTLTAQSTSPATIKEVTLKENVTGSTGTALAVNANIIIANDIQIAAANEIDFSGNISGAGKTLTINTPLFKSTTDTSATAEISLSQLTISQTTTIKTENASKLRFNLSQINGTKNLTFAENATELSLVNGIQINPNLFTDRNVICEGSSFFNGTLDNSGSITANGAVQITGNVSNSGTITCNAAATFKGDFTNTNGTLTGDTTNGSDLVFEKNYSGTGTSELTASKGYTKFQKNVDLSSTTFTHTSGIVNFTGNGTSQTLTTQSDGSTNFYDVLITSPATVATSSSFIVSGTSWTSHTDSACFTASSPSAITFNNASAPATAPLTTVSGNNNFYDVICKTANQNITFTSDNIFSNTITLGEASAIPGTVIIISASSLTFNPNLYCKNLTLNAGTNAVTFSGDSNFISTFTNEASGILTFTGSAAYGNSFVNSSENDTIIKKSFTGSGNASFAGDLKLTDNNDRSISAGAGKSIISNGNLFIDTNAANIIQLNSNLNSLIRVKNILLYSGKLTLNGTLESTEDIILLGPDYATLDPQTGIEGIYLYHQTRPSPVNYTSDFRAAPYNGELTALENAIMKTGKNFYSNGITMQGPASGQWTIQLPKTSISQHGFAEAIKTSVSGSKVCSWEALDNAATDDTAPAKIAAYECTDNSGNLNWYFEDFIITTAWTERDDAIYVEFNAPVRNRDNEITNALSYLTYKGTAAERTAFTGIYTAPDCQNANHISGTDIELTAGHYRLYLKAPDSWNTDATGKSAGTTEKSSDRNGNHKTSIPYLDIPRSLTAAQAGTSGSANVSYIITNKWGKRLNNYSTRTTTPGKAYGTNEAAGNETIVLDKTGPVLWSVRTGQELHTAYSAAAGEAGQHSYDSHNFLEFRYSEPVSFGSPDTTVCDISIPAYSSGTTVNLAENIKVTDRFGAIKESITSAADTLTFAGLATLTAPAAGTSSQLQLYTGTQGSANKYMNALYRTDEYSLRLSIAGWTDGIVTDYSGNTYKNWTGYIEKATQFTGAKAKPAATTSAPNLLIKDQAGNAQIEYEANKVEPLVHSDSSSDNTSHLLPISPDVYSAWDISEPVFTPLRFSAETAWSDAKDVENSEAIGNTNGSGSTLDRIDFHFFDNTPAYSSADTAEWFTESGWCIPGSEGTKANLYNSSYTYAADIIGGARQFDPVSARRTSGGIRLSTKLNAATGFKYSTDPYEANPSTAFASGLANIHSTVISQLFTGSSEPMHSANDPDGLYLGIGITDTALPVETSFAFKYDASKAYLTDLAGNRLRNKTSKTIDRTPPSFDIILSPVNQKQLYIVFVKEIVTNSSKIRLRYADGSERTVDENYLNMLPACFQIISINSDGSYTPSQDIQIDTSAPAKIIDRYSDRHFTCVSLTLTKNITYEDIKNLYVQLTHHPDYPETSPDPYTSNSNARVTFIQDDFGNYMQMYSAHALSDFAVGLINPLYAYASDITENDEPVMNGLYEQGSWAVHDWDADQKNYGTLPAAHSAAIVAVQEDGTEDASQIPQNVRIYLSNSPDKDSVASQFNKDFKTSLRVWLPDLTDGIFRSLSAKNNSRFSYVDSSLLKSDSPAEGLIFNIPLEIINSWKSGDQISFMFGITESDGSPVKIYNSPYYDNEHKRYDYALSSQVPLYSLRMHDITDIGTLDLWSFRLKGITEQRGGVTILNNVINPLKGEKTVVKVNLPEEGRLNVSVLTVDGNVIAWLNRGTAKAGEHYFSWDGKNRSGTPVARGMYFIRVTGTDIDETRKVMVVKDD